MGKLIVIEGLDGSGKATQSALLYESLQSNGVKCIKVSFPDYDSNSSALVKMYLNGEFGDTPDAINAYAASSFYAVDRYSSYIKKWKDKYEDGFVVIADRYTTSNMIHQCSKLPKEMWDHFLEWLIDYEYNLLGIPEPSKIVYLRNDILKSQELMSSRYNGDESRKDIHEKDVEYLKKCNIAADYCAEKYKWNIVDCLDLNERLKSIEEIHQDVIKAIML